MVLKHALQKIASMPREMVMSRKITELRGDTGREDGISCTRLHSRSAAEEHKFPVPNLDCASSPSLSLASTRGFPPLVLSLKINNMIASHMWSLN